MKLFAIVTTLLLSSTVPSLAQRGPPRGQGSAVGTPQDRELWWTSLSEPEQAKLVSLFDADWFENGIDEEERIAYAYLAQGVYDFLNSGADSNPDDFYTGFAPLMLRASFHGAGTYHSASGTGGSNGGTIFQASELADEGNACIAGAPQELFQMFHGGAVPLSDAMVIAGVVALDVMKFPRMDLLSITGGRDMIDDIAHRDRLPNPDNDPMRHFQRMYDLTLAELTALIGGAHNFGSAHGKCTGYVGQWTATPLSWFGPEGSDPSFFPDLLRDDWSWYEVCTYENNTSIYTSIADPFAPNATAEEEEEEEGEEDSCAIQNNEVPLICEEQARRGCDFEDGAYDASVPPCDINLLQFRLKSDFALKKNPALVPFAAGFAQDPDFLAEQFGIAYHKITHLGIDRCGLSGHGCTDGTECQQVGNHPYSKTCVAIASTTPVASPASQTNGTVIGAIIDGETSEYNNLENEYDENNVEAVLLYVVTGVCTVTLFLAALTACKLFQNDPTVVKSSGASDTTSQGSTEKLVKNSPSSANEQGRIDMAL
ncbi:MAG: hypothetical protein SGARI_002948 [Bacillariaceae sp.]